METKSSNGVILAHGGVTAGYALYLRDGKLRFTVREEGVPITVISPEPPVSPEPPEVAEAPAEPASGGADGGG